jgi:hypothetical protein
VGDQHGTRRLPALGATKLRGAPSESAIPIYEHKDQHVEMPPCVESIVPLPYEISLLTAINCVLTLTATSYTCYVV